MVCFKGMKTIEKKLGQEMLEVWRWGWGLVALFTMLALVGLTGKMKIEPRLKMCEELTKLFLHPLKIKWKTYN